MKQWTKSYGLVLQLQKGKGGVIRFRGTVSTPVVSVFKSAIESKNNNNPVSNVQETQMTDLQKPRRPAGSGSVTGRP